MLILLIHSIQPKKSIASVDSKWHFTSTLLSKPCTPEITSPVRIVCLADGQPAEGDVHDGVPRRDEAVKQAERQRHQQGVAVAKEIQYCHILGHILQ